MTTYECRELYATRTAAQLRDDQLAGIARWEESANRQAAAEQSRRENRQAGTEARRRLEALRRTQAALLQRSELVVEQSLQLIDQIPPRAVVVHRLDWMRERFAQGLVEQGFTVLATEHDGADGLGVSIAEQPDLLVVEDRLPSVRAIEVVSALREFAPRTVVAAQVESDLDAMIEAGAAAVFSRRVPPGDVCAQLARLLQERPDRPLVVS